MKLTVAFLAALAAADAAEARSHRQARRQYGAPYENPSYGDVSSEPVVTPAPSSVVENPYIQSSAEFFDTSYPPNAVSSYPAPEATPTTPAGEEVYPSSSVYPGDEVYPPPAASSDYGAGFSTAPVYPSSEVPVYPSSSPAPSAVYPSGGYGGEASSYPVKDASSVPYGTGVYPSSGAEYPTGTGVYPASSTPLSDYVTKTFYSTSVYYESSKPVTTKVPIGTTCIPKDEADKTPLPSSAPVKVTSEYPVSEVVKTLTETLVYTVGVGKTAHPVTTEVVTTSTSTVYTTVVVTKGKPEKPTGTTTSTSTTTSTKYITVKPTPSDKVPSNGEGYPTKKVEECAAPVTVTVTAKQTVTVTKGQDKPTKPTETPKDETKYPVSSKPSKPEYPTKPSATPSGKYPIGNGTYPYPPGPTGFKTSTKPSYPVGTGYYGSDVPTKPSETSSLPYFSYVSEVYETPAPSKTPSNDYEVPYPVSTPKAAESSPAPEYGPGYEVPASSVKTPSNGEVYPTPTPAVDYGSGYGTY